MSLDQWAYWTAFFSWASCVAGVIAVWALYIREREARPLPVQRTKPVTIVNWLDALPLIPATIYDSGLVLYRKTEGERPYCAMCRYCFWHTEWHKHPTKPTALFAMHIKDCKKKPEGK